MLLDAHYLIDGVPQEYTPEELLEAVADTCPQVPGSDDACKSAQGDEADGRIVIDESIDPSIEAHDWDARKVDEYLAIVRSARLRFPLPFADVAARCRVASSLIDAIWQSGHFGLQNLALKGVWKWNCAPVGSNAAFYRSVSAATEYMDALGVLLQSYRCCDAAACDLSFKAVISQRSWESEDDFDRYGKKLPAMSAARKCPGNLVPDPSSWLVYIPFETSDYRLGGSLLAQSQGLGGGVSIQLNDPDYFIDCYEVVRELVEDGIVISGVSVGAGGLLGAVDRLCKDGPGATLDISGMSRAFEEDNVVRLLFSEVPGVVVQIRDMDFDYLDAELLLQDVAYFPLGHPSVRSTAVRVKKSVKNGLHTILDALMQKAEGED